MLQSAHLLRHLFGRRFVAPRLVPTHRWTHWLICYWHAECRRAEGAYRRVPYY
jgi:hypothetical protein